MARRETALFLYFTFIIPFKFYFFTLRLSHSVLKTNSSHFPADNSPVFITERICVYRAVRTEYLDIIQFNLILYRVKWIFVLQERRIHVQLLECSFTYIRHVHRTIILTSLGDV